MVANEIASAIHTPALDLKSPPGIGGQGPEYGDPARFCVMIVREYHEFECEKRGERSIVCTALIESGYEGVDEDVSNVVRIFGLDTQEKRVAWLDE